VIQLIRIGIDLQRLGKSQTLISRDYQPIRAPKWQRVLRPGFRYQNSRARRICIEPLPHSGSHHGSATSWRRTIRWAGDARKGKLNSRCIGSSNYYCAYDVGRAPPRDSCVGLAGALQYGLSGRVSERRAVAHGRHDNRNGEPTAPAGAFDYRATKQARYRKLIAAKCSTPACPSVHAWFRS
jgi:hypothetical protein